MRTGLLTTALLALALQGCGNGDTIEGTPAGGAAASAVESAPAATTPARAAPAAAAPATTAAQPAAKPAAPAAAEPAAADATGAGGFLAAAKGTGRAPAVLIVADGAASSPEAQQLVRSGVAALTVPATGATAARLRAALADLRRRPGIDPQKLGVVADGPAASAAAGLLAREPAVLAASLGDPPAGARRSLSRVRGPRLLLQRSDATVGGDAVDEQFLLAAPAGTLLHKYRALGDGSRADRARWISRELGA